MANKQRLKENEVSSARDASHAVDCVNDAASTVDAAAPDDRDYGDPAQRSRRPPTSWSSKVEPAGTGPAMRAPETSLGLSAASSAPVVITGDRSYTESVPCHTGGNKEQAAEILGITCRHSIAEYPRNKTARSACQHH
jgi:hypothetical protein